MFKKLYFSLGMATAGLLMMAAPKVTTVTVTDSVTGDSSTVTTITAPITSEETTKIVSVDDANYLLDNGRAYIIDDIVDDLREEMEMQFMDRNDEPNPAVVAVCVIFPCLTIVMALIALLLFLLKKNSTRAKIITAAIEKDYKLPDSFYAAPSSVPAPAPIPADNVAANNANGYNGNYTASAPGATRCEQGPIVLGAPTVPVAQRDPKSFSSGVTMVAIGFVIIVAFSMGHEPVAGFICGGIPFFLGIGRLVGYFYVPGYRSGKPRYYQPQPNNGYNHAAPYQQNYNNMQGTQGYSGQAQPNPQPQQPTQANAAPSAPAQCPPIPPAPNTEIHID